VVTRFSPSPRGKDGTNGDSVNDNNNDSAERDDSVTKKMRWSSLSSFSLPFNDEKNDKNDSDVSNIIDRFDDSRTLSPETRTSILNQQRTCPPPPLSPSSSHPILSTGPPPSVPSNLPASKMEIPVTKVTELDNGLRVASIETYGQVCTFGMVSNCGSRLEDETNTGVNHLMELLAYNGTTGEGSMDASSFTNRMDRLGGATFASSGREQFLYCVDVLRPNVEDAMGMLASSVLHPRLEESDVDDVKRIVEYQWMDLPPEIKMGEGLQIAGYGKLEGGEGTRQQLGRPHFCPLEALPNLSADKIRDFRDEYLLAPEEMVIAGAGIGHDEFVSMAEKHFGHLKRKRVLSHQQKGLQLEQNPYPSSIIPSTYTGGDYRLVANTIDKFTRVSLAFPTGGWHSSDLVPACVLVQLLGGGSSFSAGGPGKGMYSRLYRQVLNRYHWVNSAEAFSSFHSESGLLGISGSCHSDKSGDMTRTIAEHLLKLAAHPVSDEELDRARNMLKCNVLTQLESRLVLFEDLGRQILTYGKREGIEDVCNKVDAVTANDIRNLVRRVVLEEGNIPTLSTVGDEVDNVPKQEDIEKWFRP